MVNPATQRLTCVVSPESITRDYRYERPEYAALAVPEGWIIEPLSAKVTLLLWEEGLYAETVFAHLNSLQN